MNTTTGAERYNKRMNDLFERARAIKKKHAVERWLDHGGGSEDEICAELLEEWKNEQDEIIELTDEI